MTLPCGRVYLPEIRTSNVTTLRVVGRTVVFVGGDVRTSSPLRLELAPGAEIDLIVAGAFAPTNTVTLGAPGRALDLRLYVAGPVTLSSPLVMSGYLYAPTSPFTPSNTVDLEGAALVGGLTVSSPFTVRPGGPIAQRDVCLGP
ncbi:MAG: hypothetical protein EOO75_18445 [Myxococcales bacterium]|nr:MAG: hypothetical protein EOO75_18445 [Myxococcales bacterium]